MPSPEDSIKVLVIGSGGREHALCWKIAQSPLVDEVICAPGNAGISGVARLARVDPNDADAVLALARAEAPGLVVIGPEDPLAAGLADRLRDAGFDVFGPGAEGAQLEASKSFTKDLLRTHRIPTATARSFDRSGQAKGYLEGCTAWPQVVKADGLAAGKGVYICHDLAEAKAAVDAVMEEGRHGDAGTTILVEEFLVGEEASVFAITDGASVLVLEPVQDHKQVGDGDVGPNTGGMGVYSPVPELGKRIYKQIEQHVLLPSIHMLRREQIPFRGVLFIGLMLTEGGPRVIEYNVRFGDPECQALMRRLKSDVVPILRATARGELESIETPEWDASTCVGVVAAAEGYPGSPRKGDRITGLEAADAVEGAVVFHAGTRRSRSLDGDEDVVTSGGRVLTVTAMGDSAEEARARAYEAYEHIAFDGKFCRTDIGRRREARKQATTGA
ncbi:MAG: phosphoribosylamine--glycine ligase [Planctomycetota bacterium]